jgi:hypothetical protein
VIISKGQQRLSNTLAAMWIAVQGVLNEVRRRYQEVRFGTILPGTVVAVLADRFVRSQLFQPVVVILVQAAP